MAVEKANHHTHRMISNTSHKHQLTLTNVPVKLVPSPLFSASSSITSAMLFLTAVTSVVLLASFASTMEGERARRVTAAGVAYLVPRRAAFIILREVFCVVSGVSKIRALFRYLPLTFCKKGWHSYSISNFADCHNLHTTRRPP